MRCLASLSRNTAVLYHVNGRPGRTIPLTDCPSKVLNNCLGLEWSVVQNIKALVRHNFVYQPTYTGCHVPSSYVL